MVNGWKQSVSVCYSRYYKFILPTSKDKATTCQYDLWGNLEA